MVCADPCRNGVIAELVGLRRLIGTYPTDYSAGHQTCVDVEANSGDDCFANTHASTDDHSRPDTHASTNDHSRPTPTIIYNAAPLASNVLNTVAWLGCADRRAIVPKGSGVMVNIDGIQYLATAAHLLEDCTSAPYVRANSAWIARHWQIVGIDRGYDVAVLKTNAVLNDHKVPASYGPPKSLDSGRIGYALGFPAIFVNGKPITDHIAVVDGKPIPMPTLVVANVGAQRGPTYSSAYVNAGYSGGGIIFPLDDDQWTIVGVITGFPYLHRPVHPEPMPTPLYSEQHTGIVQYAPWSVVEKLI